MAVITLNPASAAPGKPTVVTGEGFGWKWWNDITFDGVRVARVQCSTSGKFTTTFVVPAGTLAGPHTVKARTYYRSAQATLTVTGIPVPPPPPPPPVPVTGLDTRRDGWAKFRPIYVTGDPGFGLDSDFQPNLATVNPDGSLTITAKRQQTPSGRAYAAACVGTKDTFAQLHGFFEARIRYPKGQGLWPAFWLLQAGKNVSPPEVDIFEAYPAPPGAGGGSGANVLIATNHAATGSGPAQVHDAGIDLTANFHTIGLDWRAGWLRFYLDGVKFGEITQRIPTVPLYPILNLAAGAPGYRVSSATPATAVMEVSWVAVSP